MLIRDFLNFLLDDTLEEARLRATGPAERLGFLGAERANRECREELSGENFAGKLGALLHEARQDAAAAVQDGAPDQWFWFTREMHVEWIANVVSVVLLQHRLPTIVPPTRGAALAAARLAGVRASD